MKAVLVGCFIIKFYVLKLYLYHACLLSYYAYYEFNNFFGSHVRVWKGNQYFEYTHIQTREKPMDNRASRDVGCGLSVMSIERPFDWHWSRA